MRGGPILILEDNFLIAWDLHDMLTRAGFDVLEPTGGNEHALRLIENSEPAFALLDYNLGGQTSVRTARALDERRIPFAYISGQQQAIERDPDAPQRPILTKPLTPQQLVAALSMAT